MSRPGPRTIGGIILLGILITLLFSPLHPSECPDNLRNLLVEHQGLDAAEKLALREPLERLYVEKRGCYYLTPIPSSIRRWEDLEQLCRSAFPGVVIYRISVGERAGTLWCRLFEEWFPTRRVLIVMKPGTKQFCFVGAGEGLLGKFIRDQRYRIRETRDVEIFAVAFKVFNPLLVNADIHVEAPRKNEEREWRVVYEEPPTKGGTAEERLRNRFLGMLTVVTDKDGYVESARMDK